MTTKDTRRPYSNMESIGKTYKDEKIIVSRGEAIAAYEKAKQGLIALDDKRELTRAEQIFAQCIARGETLAAAYQAAYPIQCKEAQWNYRELHSRGYSLSRDPAIIAASLELMKDGKGERYHTALRIQRMRRRILEELAADTSLKPSDRIKALEKLGELPDVQIAEADNASDLTAQDAPDKILDAIFKIIDTDTDT